ncbi:MAG: ABC transporter substrate-binding protein [Muribaculaceae bacterium]|nr:ABC transporter substrate-binding protein [Muribaculaceae bacterium]
MKSKKTILFVLPLVFLMFSCGGRNGNSGKPNNYNVPLYVPEYAGGFKISGAPETNNTMITISNPWQGSGKTELELLINRDGRDIPNDFKGQVVDGNVSRAVAMSSTHVAMFDAVGAVDRVVGVSGLNFITNPNIQAGRDTIGDVGYENNINYELIVSLDPDIVLLYGVNGASPMEEKLRELKIPYIYIGDYLEESPLGKAEWMMVIAELVGKREQSEHIYNEIPKRYNELRERVAESVIDAPSVMFNIPYGDSWFMPSTQNYVARLVTDAGGHYIYEKNTGNTSQPIDLE